MAPLMSAVREQFPSLRVDVEPEREVVRVVPIGELDMATVGQLAAELAALRDVGFKRLVLDLRRLEFMDSIERPQDPLRGVVPLRRCAKRCSSRTGCIALLVVAAMHVGRSRHEREVLAGDALDAYDLRSSVPLPQPCSAWRRSRQHPFAKFLRELGRLRGGRQQPRLAQQRTRDECARSSRSVVFQGEGRRRQKPTAASSSGP